MQVFDYDPEKKTLTEVTEADNTPAETPDGGKPDKKSGENKPVNREGHLRTIINYSDRF